MDIKDASLKAAEEVLKTPSQSEEIYIVPEDSDCIKDIDNVCVQVNEFISKSIKQMESNNNQEENAKTLNTCMESLRLLDTYRNIRLNVELSSKIKFNITGRKNKE